MKTEDLYDILPVIDNSSLVDKVELNLLNLFTKKELNPGDSIPKEIELAEMMGVSRTVIRETLTRLKTMGLIETRKKKGAVIKSPDIAEILQKSLIPRILDQNTLRNIFEIRLIIEVGMADFIVDRASDKDIEELYSIVKDEVNASKDVLFDVDHEILFHGKLYEITGNDTLKSFQRMLLPVFNYAYSSGIINKQFNTKHYVSHKELVEILKERDANKFRKGMRRHLENHFKRILNTESTSESQ